MLIISYLHSQISFSFSALLHCFFYRSSNSLDPSLLINTSEDFVISNLLKMCLSDAKCLVSEAEDEWQDVVVQTLLTLLKYI